MYPFTFRNNGVEKALSHGVIPATGKRVTSADTTDTQKSAPKNSVFFYSLDSISGTGRNKTAAGRKKRRDDILISSDEADKEDFRQPLYWYFIYHAFLQLSGLLHY
jgi:hypothetical protein